MAKVGPLTPAQAKRTLAARFAPKADKLRQLHTRFGARPYRLFLVWTQWSGEERGEGDERVLQELEFLPTPKVESLDAVALNPMTAGLIAMGSIRVSEVSAATFTEDKLRGLVHPTLGHVDHIPEPFDFFYEMREDGRGDDPAWRSKYRLSTTPMRRATKLDFMFMLERISEDRSRAGKNVITSGTR